MDGRASRLMMMVVGLIASLAVGAACQTMPASPLEYESDEQVPRLGVLPLANYSGRMEAIEVLVPGIYERVQATGVKFLTAEDLRPLLREYRIRSIGRIGAGGAVLIRWKTGVNYLLLGSIDIYDDQSLEVGISLRILNARTLTLVKATSVAAAAEDYTGFFDIGRVTDIKVVADRVLDKAFEDLGWPLLTPRKPVPPDATHIAIIPFENMSEMPQANAIMENIILSNLLAEGYVTMEPGIVNEVFLMRRTMARGQIDLATLAFLHDTYSLDVAVTGVVGFMQPARGDLTLNVPSLAFGARLLDADTGHLRAAWDIRREGSDGEWLLGFGRTSSLGQLGSEAARKLIRLLDIELDDSPPEGDPLGE